MTPIDRRVRLWAWMVRWQGSVATKSEAEVIAMQSRRPPDNGLFNRIFGTVAPGTEVHDRVIGGPAGDIPVRVYRPTRTDPGARPLILNFHGGGFVFGDLRLSDWICSSGRDDRGRGRGVGGLPARAGAPVPRRRGRLLRGPGVGGGERRGPGRRRAGEGAPPRIGVMGESAGGNLAAVTCLLARDRGGPRISHQALLYPPTDMTRMSPGAATSLILNAPEMLAYRRHYLGGADPADPRASPLLAGDHRGLPPALIQVGEHDPLRDDGVRYAAALRSAGVPVRFTEYVGMPHGYLNFPGICRSARQALAEICAEQAAALAEPAAVPGTQG